MYPHFAFWPNLPYQQAYLLNHKQQHSPGCPVVKNQPDNAGGHWFDSWSRKIPHAMGQLNPWAATTEACEPKRLCWQPDKPPPREACALQSESSLHSPPSEKAHAQQWRPSVAKKPPFSQQQDNSKDNIPSWSYKGSHDPPRWCLNVDYVNCQ